MYGWLKRTVHARTIASFPTYARAQEAARRLAAGGVPLGEVAIAAEDLRPVEADEVAEPVTRALARGALIGAASAVALVVLGAIGLVVAPVAPGLQVAALALYGALVGLVAALVVHVVAKRAGGNDPLEAVRASRFDLLTTEAHAGRAAELLDSETTLVGHAAEPYRSRA